MDAENAWNLVEVASSPRCCSRFHRCWERFARKIIEVRVWRELSAKGVFVQSPIHRVVYVFVHVNALVRSETVFTEDFEVDLLPFRITSAPTVFLGFGEIRGIRVVFVWLRVKGSGRASKTLTGRKRCAVVAAFKKNVHQIVRRKVPAFGADCCMGISSARIYRRDTAGGPIPTRSSTSVMGVGCRYLPCSFARSASREQPPPQF